MSTLSRRVAAWIIRYVSFRFTYRARLCARDARAWFGGAKRLEAWADAIGDPAKPHRQGPHGQGPPDMPARGTESG